MNIALLNTRITIQKHGTTVDDIGNHVNGWENYHTCFATISGSSGGGQSGGQGTDAGMTTDHSDLSFTVRYCNKVKCVNTTEYRILLDDTAYDIVQIDWMNMKKKAIKFKCRRCTGGR